MPEGVKHLFDLHTLLFHQEQITHPTGRVIACIIIAKVAIITAITNILLNSFKCYSFSNFKFFHIKTQF